MPLSKIPSQQTSGVLPSAGGTMSGSLVIDTTTNGVPSVSLRHSNSEADNFIIQAGTPGVANSGFTIRDIDAAANRFVIDTAGRITMPSQPAFFAMMNNTNITSTAAIVFEDVYVNRGNHYSASNGRFTAPVAGTYLFAANFLKRSGSGRLAFTKNDAYYGSGNGHTYSGNAGGAEIPHAATIIITLAAGDYVNVVASVDSGDVYGNSNSHNSFSGFLLG